MALSVEFFMSRIARDSVTGCWLWTGMKCSKGYGKISQGIGGKRYPASRFSYEQFVSPVPSWEGLDCCHKCDTPACVNPEHLFIGTRSDNIKDCVRKGRHWTHNNKEKAIRVVRANVLSHVRSLRGRTHPNASLNKYEATAAINMVRAGMSQPEVGSFFGVSRSVINHLWQGDTYRCAREEADE